VVGASAIFEKPHLHFTHFRPTIRAVTHFRLFAIVSAVIAALSYPAVSSAQDLADKAIQVWELVRDAEKDEAGSNGSAAYEKYKEAIRILREMRAADPNWNPHLVDFRLKDCAERIEALEKSGRHVQQPPPVPLPGATATPGASAPSPFANPEQRMREELAKLRADLEREKNDRAEIQRKLTATEDQLRRSQVPPSAETARLRRERQQMENQLRDARQRALEFQQRAAQADAALAALKTAQDELSTVQAALQAAERDSKRQHEELVRTANALEAAQKDSAARLSALAAEKSEFERRLMTSAARIKQLETELKNAPSKELVQQLQTQLRDETARSAELQRQLAANAGAMTQLVAVREENTRLQQSLNDARQSLRQRDDELKHAVAALDETRKNHAAQIAALTAERDLLQQNLAAAAKQVRELQAANATLVAADQHQELQDKYRALQEQNLQLGNSIAQKTQQLAKLQSVQAELDASQKLLEEAWKLAEQRGRQVAEAEQALAAFQKESGAKLAALNSEKRALERQLAANAQRIRELERKNAPPDTVPKTEFDVIQSELDGVRSQLEISQQALAAAQRELEDQKREANKLNEALLSAQSRFQSQLADLSAAKQELEARLRAATDRIAALENASPANRAEDPKLAAELEREKAERAALEKQITAQEAAMRAAMKEMSRQLEVALSQKKELEAKHQEVQAKLSEASRRAEQLAAEKQQLEARLAQSPPPASPAANAQAAATLAALRVEKRDLEARVVQMERQMRQIDSARQAIAAQKERAEKQFADSQRQLAASQRENAQFKSQVSSLTAQLEQARRETEAAKSAQPARDTRQVAALKSDNRALQATVEKQRGEISKLQRELEQMRKAVARNAAPLSAVAPAGGAAVADGTDEMPKATLLPDSARAELEFADQLASASKFDEAAVAYESLLARYPRSVIVIANLGVVRMKQERHDDALKLLSRAVALAPDDSFSHSMLGLCYFFGKDYDNALAALSRAIALDPKDALSLNYRGTTCAKKGWYEAAENDLRRAIELQPKFGDAHRNLASVYMKQRPASPRLAGYHYRKSLELGVEPDAGLQKSIEEKVGGRLERNDSALQPQ
jgi:chromosome segregation ATPase